MIMIHTIKRVALAMYISASLRLQVLLDIYTLSSTYPFFALLSNIFSFAHLTYGMSNVLVAFLAASSLVVEILDFL